MFLALRLCNNCSNFDNFQLWLCNKRTAFEIGFLSVRLSVSLWRSWAVLIATVKPSDLELSADSDAIVKMISQRILLSVAAILLDVQYLEMVIPADKTMATQRY